MEVLESGVDEGPLLGQTTALVTALSLCYSQFTVSALEHRIYEVRDSAVQIILDLYREHRAVVLEHLPPDDAVTRKNVLYRTIFEGFARIDGRPTDAELRVRACGGRAATCPPGLEARPLHSQHWSPCPPASLVPVPSVTGMIPAACLRESGQHGRGVPWPETAAVRRLLPLCPPRRASNGETFSSRHRGRRPRRRRRSGRGTRSRSCRSSGTHCGSWRPRCRCVSITAAL